MKVLLAVYLLSVSLVQGLSATLKLDSPEMTSACDLCDSSVPDFVIDLEGSGYDHRYEVRITFIIDGVFFLNTTIPQHKGIFHALFGGLQPGSYHIISAQSTNGNDFTDINEVDLVIF